MIYDFPPEEAPIRQGDIFIGVPRIDMSLTRIPIIDEKSQYNQTTETTWKEIVATGNPVAAVVSIKPVTAIVATQDCDTIRAPDITLCEIRPFREVERKSKDTSSVKGWVGILTQHARINLKWFYLPPNNTLGFDSKMGVDFMVTLRVPREELEDLKSLRKGRLNNLAEEHFRERIGEFFRRYPYDEWYSLSQEEMAEYSRQYPDANPFPWQSTAG